MATDKMTKLKTEIGDSIIEMDDYDELSQMSQASENNSDMGYESDESEYDWSDENNESGYETDNDALSNTRSDTLDGVYKTVNDWIKTAINESFHNYNDISCLGNENHIHMIFTIHYLSFLTLK